MKKTLGIIRNKNSQLSELRKHQKHKNIIDFIPQGSRFSKERLGGKQEIEMVTFDQSLNMKKPFIEDLSTVNTIETPKPTWIVQFEKGQTLLRGVEELRKEMLTNQNKRLTCVKVSEQKGYELKIYDCAKQATSLIKMCQNILEDLKSQAQFQTSVQSKVCETASNRLAFDIQEATKKLRLQQKSFVEQRKQFEMTEKASFLDLAIEDAFNMGGGFEDDLIEDEVMRDLEERNEEIKNIVQSIYELNDIYKQVQGLVVIQGSILDRIDQNIEVAHVAVQKGLEHLESANKKQKRGSRCACKVMVVLCIANAILLIILCNKWF